MSENEINEIAAFCEKFMDDTVNHVVANISDITNDLNAFLSSSGIAGHTVSSRDIVLTSKSILIQDSPERLSGLAEHDITPDPITTAVGRQMLRDVIKEYLFQAHKDSIFHYTSAISAIKMIGDNGTNSCSLAHTGKKEFHWFYKRHSIRGYAKKIVSRLFDHPISAFHMSKENYYISFSNTPINKKLWKYFGDKERGCVFEFEPNLCIGELRNAMYSFSAKNNCPKHTKKSLTIINELQKIGKKYNRDLILPGISKMGVFYLWSKYKPQKEIRYAFNLLNLNASEKAVLGLKFTANDHTTYPDKILIPFGGCNSFIPKKVILGKKITKKNRTRLVAAINSKFPNVIISDQV